MLGIVILNYNTWDKSIICIDCINKNYDCEKTKIYLIDNASKIRPKDEVLEQINKFTNVELIYSELNKGYSAGNNIGIRRALDDGCQNILICNSDIVINDNSINIMKNYMNDNLQVGIVGPQIYDCNDDLQPFYMLKKLTAVGKLKNMMLKTPIRRLFASFEKSFIRTEVLEEPIKVFGVSGCCFMLSRECAEFLFPWDERTFLYEEEYIIGVRLESTNFEVHIIPNTHVIHEHGASTGGMSDFSYKCLIESEQIYLKDYLHTGFVMRKLIYAIRKIKGQIKK